MFTDFFFLLRLYGVRDASQGGDRKDAVASVHDGFPCGCEAATASGASYAGSEQDSEWNAPAVRFDGGST